jgi:hypothetical protein
MTSEQAKEILLRFRPGGADANDPEFTPALDQVRMDVELQVWFEEHCAHQSLIRKQFRAIAVPDGLERSILNGIGRSTRIVWWRRPVNQVLAAAAAVVALIVTVHFWTRPAGGGFSTYRNRMVRAVQRLYRMDMVTNNLAEIRQYLARNQAQADYVLPSALEKLPADGCAVLTWRNKKISLLCFNTSGRDDLYLFILNRDDVPDSPTTDRPQFQRIGKLTSASWSRGSKAYILAGRGDEAFVRRYLE